ncbi:hypothetical protein PROFUN_13372 [Planoprotostelium fungivorum]|uniref:Uncharacterized protein n=1 Tax=Planoprotostelium fungivorum TaxID=1890364 RepID=A0A2P6MZS1_9EUKA|nr:hypothetical protein PROFUN_13372 [Planoprotostelium fungivorum]
MFSAWSDDELVCVVDARTISHFAAGLQKKMKAASNKRPLVGQWTITDNFQTHIPHATQLYTNYSISISLHCKNWSYSGWSKYSLAGHPEDSSASKESVFVWDDSAVLFLKYTCVNYGGLSRLQKDSWTK